MVKRIYDSVTERTYTGDWMPLCTSKSMYLKRDIYSEDEGFLYDGEDQSGLDYAYILQSVPALWRTPEDREKLRQAFAWKKRAWKNTRAFLKCLEMIPFEQQCKDYKTAYYQDIPKPNSKIIELLHDSKIEAAIKKLKKMRKQKSYKMNIIPKLQQI